MTRRKIYKHKFIVTVLSEEERAGCPLTDVDYLITSGPDLGWVELESIEEITDRDTIIQECIALHNDGSFFTEVWDEQDEGWENGEVTMPLPSLWNDGHFTTGPFPGKGESGGEGNN